MTLAHRSTIVGSTRDQATGSWTATLVVDESDSVIFDHSVDHLPGMLIVQGIAELVEWASLGLEPRTAGVFDLDFTSFAEKGLPVHIRITPTGAPHRWRVETAQSGRVGCSGTVGSIARGDADVAPADPAVTPDTCGAPADAALVHRSRPENVVISALRTAPGGYEVDYLPAEAARSNRLEPAHGPLDVIEAARQFVILLSHTACGLDLSTRLVLSRLVVQFPWLFPRTVPVRLQAVPPRVNRHRLDCTIQARCGDAPASTVSWGVMALSPKVYARVRGIPHE